MTLRKHKYAILLAASLGVAIVESFSHRLLLGPILSDLAIATTELLVVLIVFDRRVNRLVAFVVLAVALAGNWAHYVLPPDYSETPLRLINHSAVLVLIGFATIVILRNIFEQRVVRSDDVLGAVCGYLLAAGAWSNLFMLIELNYVSLGSLTSVGSGQVVPVRPPATMLVTLEAVFGQFYIAVVVAQLVGARLSQAPQRNSSPQT